MMVSEDGIRHYTAIKSLSRLLSSKNSNTKRKQRKNLAEINIKFTARTTSLLELRCLNRVQPLSSKMDRIKLKSHLQCTQILNQSLNWWTLWNQDIPINLTPMKLINTHHLAGCLQQVCLRRCWWSAKTL